MSDAKRFIIEDIAVTSILALTLSFDFIVNILNKFGYRVIIHDTGSHPISIGFFQIIILLVLSVLFLAKRIDDKRYY